MAEGRPVQIERHRQIARLFVADDLEEHGKKTENGVGKDAVLVGKRRKGVKSAVHEAVAIDDDKGIRLRHGVLLFQRYSVTIMIPQRGQKYKRIDGARRQSAFPALRYGNINKEPSS